MTATRRLFAPLAIRLFAATLILAVCLCSQNVLAGPPALTTPGQSISLLPDGSWLRVGGFQSSSDMPSTAETISPQGARSSLPGNLQYARAGHSATTLADGRLLVFGGRDRQGATVQQAEVFDPVSRQFSRFAGPTPVARVDHTATLLTDGRLLIVGGIDQSGAALKTADLWAPATGELSRVSGLSAARSRHQSTLLADGTIAITGGVGEAGQDLPNSEVFDYKTKRWQSIRPSDLTSQLQALDGVQPPLVQTSIPAPEATGFPINQPIAVRFNKRFVVPSFDVYNVTLMGPAGVQTVRTVMAENGELLFVWPTQDLMPGSRYTLFVVGGVDFSKQRLPMTPIGFDTARVDATTPAVKSSGSNTTNFLAQTQRAGRLSFLGDDVPESQRSAWEAEFAKLPPRERAAILQAEASEYPEDWIPAREHFKGDWRAKRGQSPLQLLPMLGVPGGGGTALAGQVLTMNGRAMPGVSLRIGSSVVRSDVTGRFLLRGLAAGGATLQIDGATANRANTKYGYYAARVQLHAGKTTTLPYVIWMPRLDPAGTVQIGSPTANETVVRSPRIPGLELHIPAGTIIRDRDGKIVTEVNITAIPTDRPPFPVPDLGVPVYFTVQPGGAVLQSINGTVARGAQLYYPNFRNEVPGARGVFWNYDPSMREWYVYGLGTINPRGTQAVPDAGVTIQEFTGAMFNGGNAPPPPGPPPCGSACCSPGGGGPGGGGGGGGWGGGSRAGSGNCGNGGDPVNLYTGQFEHTERDLMIPDVLPIDLTRTYRALDKNQRSFGIGMTDPYNIFLYSANQYQEVDLILPHGGRIHYVRTSPGNSYSDAVFESSAGGEWYKSAIVRDNSRSGWQLSLRDGRKWFFLQYQPISEAVDSNGNLTRIIRRDGGGLSGPVVKVMSPGGRYVSFGYNAAGFVSDATDNIGRKFRYEYDDAGRLLRVIDPLENVRAYTWDTTNNRITNITDPNGKTMVINEYDASGRVFRQTLADNSKFTYAYIADANGHVTQTDVTDRRGSIRRVQFNADGQVIKNIFPLGKAEEQTTSYEMTGGLVRSVIDARGRTTSYEYDSLGNITKVTRLAGTANPVSTSYVWDPSIARVTSSTDGNGKVSLFTYDAAGNLLTATDPLNNGTQITYDSQGRPVQFFNPYAMVGQLTYEGPDLSSVTDALGRKLQYFTDAVGRSLASTQPLGQRQLQEWDSLNRMTRITDPMGQTIGFSYDANGNPLTQTDARSNVTTFTYNAIGKPASMKDALLKTETSLYEPGGLLKQRTDRKGQVTGLTYDSMGRVKTIGFGATAATPTTYTSTITLTWDNGNRLTQIVDSVGGTITRSYDELDRLTREVTPQGEVNYTYDKADRRKTMIVKNGAPGAQTVQPTVTYGWDDAGRLLSITQAAGAVNNNVAQAISFTYDKANRRTQTKLANGSTINYTYDDADQLTKLEHKKSDNTLLGDLTYTYDANGRRTSMGGSLARVNLPTADVTDASYNANNQLTRWSGKTFGYDANGSLLSDGSSTYAWDARNQLKSVTTPSGSTGANGSFGYDAQGRRTGKTIGSTTTGYLYGGLSEDNFAQELLGSANTSGVQATLLTAGIDETLLREKGGALHSFIADGNNNTVQLSDASQAKIVAYTYEPYGRSTNDSASATNTQQYTGRELDSSVGNGLYYYRNRYYMPGCGRFISEDPIGWASGQANNYAYVGGDPVSDRDPRGLYSCGMPTFDEWWGEANDAWNNTNETINSWFPDIPFTDHSAPMFGTPAKVAATVAGGATAASYGGQTFGQAARDAYFPKPVKYPYGPAITPMKTPIYWPRVAATSVIKGAATSAAWAIGVAIGSGVSPFANRAMDSSCN